MRCPTSALWRETDVKVMFGVYCVVIVAGLALAFLVGVMGR